MCEYNETDRITPKVKIKNKMQRMQTHAIRLILLWF